MILGEKAAAVVHHRDILTEKREMWMTAAKHFCGDHSNCVPHGECKSDSLWSAWRGRNSSRCFCKKAMLIVETCVDDHTTQANESHQFEIEIRVEKC